MGKSISRAMGVIAFSIILSLSMYRANSLLCNDKEKQALLSIKQALTDPTNRLSSWSVMAHDCCAWTGVRCHNVSGRVVELHLGNWNEANATSYQPIGILGGELSPALLQLQFLNYLDLSYNDFGGIPIPSFLGSMQYLTALDLSNASFGGLIPHQLGNLSSLRNLSLGCDAESCELYVDDFSWISLLSSLEYLIISGIDLHKEVHWLDHLSVLPSLSGLTLAYCQLEYMNPSPEYGNFTSLSYLYLPSNNFHHVIPNWLFNLTSLVGLDLSDDALQGQLSDAISNLHNLEFLNFSSNALTGQIPESLGQLKHLEGVALDSNSLCGPIPSSLGNMSSLSDLYCYTNKLNGTLPTSLGLLSNLERLIVGDNLIEGSVSQEHFAKLFMLIGLDMASTSVTFNMSHDWVPPFQLESLYMDSCKMGPKFPAWLQTQTSLQFLYLPNVGIVDTTPSWFWKWVSQVQEINLSHNQISGDLSRVLLNNTVVILDSNRFMGKLPRVTPNVVALTMSNNSFSGQISSFLCQKMNGRSGLGVLDVSDNALSGELSNCLMHWPSLTHLNLGSNNLSGTIPDSIASLILLKALHLHKNNFSGNLPLSLRNCTSLGLLDLAQNKLTGNIPLWIGERTALMVLRFSSNELFGDLPPQICLLSSLIVLDLADNRISGSIPRCLNNISAMASNQSSADDHFNVLLDNSYFGYPEDLSLFIKGRESEYRSILPFVRMVDLSRNKFSGPIPNEISSLSGLQSLNLSRNHLVGRIPDKIGGIRFLESLDLSRNHLSGEIPQSIVDLTFLNHLDLSHNNLSGRIPVGAQIQGFDALNFMGNAELCGVPLLKNCTDNEVPQGEGVNPNGEEEGFEICWFYIGMASGFIVSFWGVCGALFCNRAWRHAYFRFLVNMKHGVSIDLRCLRFGNKERREESDGGSQSWTPGRTWWS